MEHRRQCFFSFHQQEDPCQDFKREQSLLVDVRIHFGHGLEPLDQSLTDIFREQGHRLTVHGPTDLQCRMGEARQSRMVAQHDGNGCGPTFARRCQMHGLERHVHEPKEFVRQRWSVDIELMHEPGEHGVLPQCPFLFDTFRDGLFLLHRHVGARHTTVLVDDHVHGPIFDHEQDVLAAPALGADIVVRDAVEEQYATADGAFFRIDLEMGRQLVEHLVQDDGSMFGIVNTDRVTPSLPALVHIPVGRQSMVFLS